jgi:diguanylate cyclase (GGDEF)-like protein
MTSLTTNQKYVGKLVVCHDITQRKALEEGLRHLSRTDALTQVCNRRHFIQLAENELERSHRYGHDLALILLDCDHFKDINDRYGHLTGDQALISLACLCQENLRSSDTIARYGGEEFMILCPESGAKKAWHLAERLRSITEGTPLQTDKGPIALTISLGVVSLGSDLEASLETLLERADHALYHSKNAGRNRVTLWRPEQDD